MIIKDAEFLPFSSLNGFLSHFNAEDWYTKNYSDTQHNPTSVMEDFLRTLPGLWNLHYNASDELYEVYKLDPIADIQISDTLRSLNQIKACLESIGKETGSVNVEAYCLLALSHVKRAFKKLNGFAIINDKQDDHE